MPRLRRRLRLPLRMWLLLWLRVRLRLLRRLVSRMQMWVLTLVPELLLRTMWVTLLLLLALTWRPRRISAQPWRLTQRHWRSQHCSRTLRTAQVALPRRMLRLLHLRPRRVPRLLRQRPQLPAQLRLQLHRLLLLRRLLLGRGLVRVVGVMLLWLNESAVRCSSKLLSSSLGYRKPRWRGWRRVRRRRCRIAPQS